MDGRLIRRFGNNLTLKSTAESHADVVRCVAAVVNYALGKEARRPREGERADARTTQPAFGSAAYDAEGIVWVSFGEFGDYASGDGPRPRGTPLRRGASAWRERGWEHGQMRSRAAAILNAGDRKSGLAGDGPDRAGAVVDHVRLPLAWFTALQRPYRGGSAPHYEAILLLGSILRRYARGHFDGPGVLYVGVEGRVHDGGVEKEAVGDVVGLTTAQRKRALGYLRDRGVVVTVTVQGTVPWWASPRPATYLFVVPVFTRVWELRRGGVDSTLP